MDISRAYRSIMMIFNRDNRSKGIRSLSRGKIRLCLKGGLMATPIMLITMLSPKYQGSKVLGPGISWRLGASLKGLPATVGTINREREVGLRR